MTRVRLVQIDGPHPYRAWYFADLDRCPLGAGLFINQERADEFAAERDWKIVSRDFVRSETRARSVKTPSRAAMIADSQRGFEL